MCSFGNFGTSNVAYSIGKYQFKAERIKYYFFELSVYINIAPFEEHIQLFYPSTHISKFQFIDRYIGNHIHMYYLTLLGMFDNILDVSKQP